MLEKSVLILEEELIVFIGEVQDKHRCGKVMFSNFVNSDEKIISHFFI